jgi:hypothetical protein
MIDLKVVEGSLEAGELNLNLGKNLTRAEFAVMLYKAFNGGTSISDTSFWNTMKAEWTDIGQHGEAGKHWGYRYANWFHSRGISAGTTTDVNSPAYPTFAPDEYIDVYQALLFCMKALGLQTDGLTPAWNYSPLTVIGLAIDMDLVNNLAWDGTFLDRATACVLLDMFIRAEAINGVANNTAGITRVTNANFPLVTGQFGYEKFTGVITSDGALFGLNALTANGKAVLGQVTDNIANTAPAVSNTITLSVDLTKELGIDMYDVGRKVEFFFIRPSNSSADITRVIGDMKFLDSVTEPYYNMGSKRVGTEAASTNRGLIGDARALVRDNAAVLTGARVYLNYKTSDFANPTTWPATYNTVLGTATMSSIVGSQWDTNFSNDMSVRMIHENGTVKYVFIEFYRFSIFDRSESNGNIRYASGFLGFGENAVRTADIVNLPSAGLAKDQRFLTYEIGARVAFKDVTVVEEAQVTRKPTDNSDFGVGTAAYKASGVANTPGTTISALVLGTKYSLYLHNGNVLQAVPPADVVIPESEWKYGVVVGSEIRVTTKGVGASVDSLGNPIEAVTEVRDARVNILKEDGTTEIFNLAGINALTTFVNGASTAPTWSAAANQGRSTAAVSLTAGQFGSDANNNMGGGMAAGDVGTYGQIFFMGTMANYAGDPATVTSLFGAAAAGINDQLWQYRVNANGTVTLREVARGSATDNASANTMNYGGNGTDSGWGTALNARFFSADSIVFIKDAAGKYSAVSGRSWTNLAAGGGSTAQQWVALGNEGNINLGNQNWIGPNIRVAFVTVAHTFVAPPPSAGAWVVSLKSDAWEEFNMATGKPRWAREFLNQDGAKITLYSKDDEANFPTIFDGALYTPTYVTGSTNVIDSIVRTTGGGLTNRGNIHTGVFGGANIPLGTLNCGSLGNTSFNASTKVFDAVAGKLLTLDEIDMSKVDWNAKAYGGEVFRNDSWVTAVVVLIDTPAY